MAVPSTARESILQAARGWLKTALSLPDAKVIPAEDDGARPQLPYLTVKVIASDLVIGADEHRYSVNPDNGRPTHYVSGPREGTISVQGYGQLTSDWLAWANQALSSPAIVAQLQAAGVTILSASTAITDLSALRDTRFEGRFGRDHRVRYRLVSSPTDQVELLTAELAMTIRSHDADPSPKTFTLPLLEVAP